MRAPSMQAELNLRATIKFEYGVPRELVPGVARIVARNPSPFTFKGTNTYLLGTTSLAVIDAGPDLDEHHDAILQAAAGRPITHVLLTHTHKDHYAGLAKLQKSTGALSCGVGRVSRAPSELRRQSPSTAESLDVTFKPDLVLRDGDEVSGPGWALTALATPGHAPDHLCFALHGRRVLFSGDHVMAWNTSVVAPPEGRMSDYLSSLERLIGRGDELYLPGHGGRLEEPERMVRAYLVHRRWREQAILGAITDGKRTINDIVALVYSGIDGKLVTAAALSVQAHVEHLIERGLVTCDGPPSFDRVLSPA